ncbi:hypothetical protein THOG11_50319 [Vibrio harveyi]|jgi:hypothetical protein|nr:hypothetical protein TH15OA1_480210 [Vibrio harveyi]CAH1571725.1 hypothetical protein THOD03_40313 [Vibrio harveyi]CAH1581862.1 hypothetical protein THOG11_50319 [Vibrio harveyi]
MLTRYIYSLLLSIPNQTYNEKLSAFGYRKNNLSFSSDLSYSTNRKCTIPKFLQILLFNSKPMTEIDLSICFTKIEKRPVFLQGR